jgi:hypothetical protein
MHAKMSGTGCRVAKRLKYVEVDVLNLGARSGWKIVEEPYRALRRFAYH